MLCTCLQSLPLETIVMSSENHVSKTDPRGKGRGDSTSALQPQLLDTGQIHFFFSFPEKHLLDCYQVLL